MTQENEPVRKLSLSPEGVLSLSQCQIFLSKCLDEGIETIHVPECDGLAPFGGELSLLHWAIYTGQIPLLESLKKAHYPLTDTACPVVPAAIIFGHLAVARWLVVHEFGSWQDTYQGGGIVYHAIKHGHSQLARELVSLKLSSWNGPRPPVTNLVQTALISGDFALAEELVEAGQSWTVGLKLKDICLHYFPRIIELLKARHFDIDNLLSSKEMAKTVTISPMVQAAIVGHEPALRYLLAKGLGHWHEECTFIKELLDLYHLQSDDSMPDSGHWQIRDVLGLFGHLELAIKLIDAETFSKLTPQRASVMAAYLLISQQFEKLIELSNFLPIKVIEQASGQLIQKAIQLHDMKLVNWLIDNDFAEWENIYNGGYQIFHFAAMAGFTPLLHCLVDEGYNHWTDETSSTGTNVLSLSIRHCHLDLARSLITAGHFNDRTPLDDDGLFVESLIHGDADFIKWMLEQGYGRLSDTYSGNTILHLMAREHNLKAIIAIGDISGLDWNRHNTKGLSILQCAFEWSFKENISFLEPLTEIANRAPHMICQPEPIHKLSPLDSVIHNDLWPLYQSFLIVLKKYHLKVSTTSTQTAIMHVDLKYAELLFAMGLETIESTDAFEAYIDKAKTDNLKQLLQAELQLKRAGTSSQDLHVRAERFCYQVMQDPKISTDFAMRLFLETIPENITAALVFRVMPRLNKCLNQVTFDRCELNKSIGNEAKQLIRGFASKGCFYLRERNAHVLFSYHSNSPQLVDSAYKQSQRNKNSTK